MSRGKEVERGDLKPLSCRPIACSIISFCNCFPTCKGKIYLASFSGCLFLGSPLLTKSSVFSKEKGEGREPHLLTTTCLMAQQAHPLCLPTAPPHPTPPHSFDHNMQKSVTDEVSLLCADLQPTPVGVHSGSIQLFPAGAHGLAAAIRLVPANSRCLQPCKCV